MKEVKIKIQNYSDRNDAVVALVNAGYKVQVITESVPYRVENIFWLVVEIPEKYIRDK